MLVRFFVAINDSKYAIETFSLTKIFQDWWWRSKVIAVEDLNLQVRSNEIYGLLGPNGSGKTTTLKLLLELLHPTKGKSLVLGGSARQRNISSRIGYLPEDSYLYKYLTARETLDFYGRIFSLPRRVRKARIDALLEMVGLSPMANRPVGTYSKGMARRIGLAQALINDPELLILDEPTSGMDPIGTRQMKDLLIELARRGKTILLCSHLLADVEDVCDRIGILYGGRMQVEGTVESLLRHSDQRQIVTGPVSETIVEKIRRIVSDEQSEFEITVPMDKLEEFFIRTVTKAQREKQRTSGAISTTEIGGFLKEDDDTGESILDKLVGAPMAEQTIATAQTVETESVDTAKGRVDIDAGLLDKLTRTSATSEPSETTVSQPESVEAGPTAEQIKQNILDELTGRAKENPAPDERDRNEQTGESDDA